jgi:predicted O-methyltransferase YrrM
MSQEKWTEVDAYLTEMLVPPDEALDAALKASDAAGLPAISVTPAQGKLLHVLAKLQGARSILEIGTLGGYSTIWLARALPADGRVVTLEVEPKHADVARENITRAGLDRVVDLRVGHALDTLPQIAGEGAGPFDLIFIDADKPNIPQYFAWALSLSRRGTLIIVDNVIREGAITDASSEDASVQAVRRMFEMLASETRVSATSIQTVGSKGYDGFVFALVTVDPRT